MSVITSPAEQRVVLQSVDWSTYEALVSRPDSRHNRIAYDQGWMEIMSPSRLHETSSRLIGRLIETFTMELAIEVASVKSTTFKCEEKDRGFEADESYYIEHAEDVRGLEEIDLTIHSAPDLVIEVDLSRSSMGKFGIYGSLGVSEVWLYDGEQVRVFAHAEGEQYNSVPRSRVLPQFPVEEVHDWLVQAESLGETQMALSFRESIRERFVRVDPS